MLHLPPPHRAVTVLAALRSSLRSGASGLPRPRQPWRAFRSRRRDGASGRAWHAQSPLARRTTDRRRRARLERPRWWSCLSSRPPALLVLRSRENPHGYEHARRLAASGRGGGAARREREHRAALVRYRAPRLLPHGRWAAALPQRRRRPAAERFGPRRDRRRSGGADGDGGADGNGRRPPARIRRGSLDHRAPRPGPHRAARSGGHDHVPARRHPVRAASSPTHEEPAGVRECAIFVGDGPSCFISLRSTSPGTTKLPRDAGVSGRPTRCARRLGAARSPCDRHPDDPRLTDDERGQLCGRAWRASSGSPWPAAATSSAPSTSTTTSRVTTRRSSTSARASPRWWRVPSRPRSCSTRSTPRRAIARARRSGRTRLADARSRQLPVGVADGCSGRPARPTATSSPSAATAG